MQDWGENFLILILALFFTLMTPAFDAQKITAWSETKDLCFGLPFCFYEQDLSTDDLNSEGIDYTYLLENLKEGETISVHSGNPYRYGLAFNFLNYFLSTFIVFLIIRMIVFLYDKLFKVKAKL